MQPSAAAMRVWSLGGSLPRWGALSMPCSRGRHELPWVWDSVGQHRMHVRLAWRQASCQVVIFMPSCGLFSRRAWVAGDHSLAQGLKGDATYLVVNDKGSLENYGINGAEPRASAPTSSGELAPCPDAEWRAGPSPWCGAASR